MLAIKLTVYLLILYNCAFTYGLKSCSDCMEIHRCPNVKNWSREEATEKWSKSLCGKGQLMICCSDFAKTENDIDNHSNIRLLPENCGKQFEDSIIGGNLAGIYEFPWMALISYVDKDSNGIVRRRFQCVGTIISSRYILTAAHCVYNKTIAGIRVGDYNFRTPTDCQGEYPNLVCESHLQDILVEKATINEAFSPNPRIKNNIAILRVNKEIDFSFKNVKPICLPVWQELRNVSLIGKQATVAGWGLTETGNRSHILQKVIVPINETNCYESLERSSGLQDHNSKTFCAGDSCYTRSGAPLMLFEDYKDNYRMIQYGIFSCGPIQCESGPPAVYTDVTKYMKWILDNMKE